MPKVTIGTEEKESNKIKSVIREYAGKALLELPEVAKMCGIPESTFYKRMKEPDSFRRWELMKVCKVLKIPEERKCELL